MHNVTHRIVLEALAATGRRLVEQRRTEPVRIVLCGAVAGILGGDLSSERMTLDCDVIVSEPREGFDAVADAAFDVAQALELRPLWLNHDSRMYAHMLPSGWKRRLRRVDRFGPLEVMVVGRRDLMALKLMGVDKRPQDLEDLESMRPTRAEIEFLAQYLTAMETESLERRRYDAQRTVLDELGS